MLPRPLVEPKCLAPSALVPDFRDQIMVTLVGLGSAFGLVMQCFVGHISGENGLFQMISISVPKFQNLLAVLYSQAQKHNTRPIKTKDQLIQIIGL